MVRPVLAALAVDLQPLPGRIGHQGISGPRRRYEAFEVAGYGLAVNGAEPQRHAVAPPATRQLDRQANIYNATLAFTPRLELFPGLRNLFDDNYQRVDGFPEEGRNYHASLRMRL